MADSCVYLPKNGSKTFIELKKRYGHEKAAHIFNIVSRSKFKEAFKDSIQLDSEGIPTFNSILNNELVRRYLTDSTIIESENKLQPHISY